MKVLAMVEQGARQIRYLFRCGGRYCAGDDEAFRRVRSEGGASVVEFALSCVILFPLMFGVLILCMALYSYLYISDAAREGSRYAMVRGSRCPTYTGFPSACPASAGDVQNYVRGLGFPGIKPSNLTVTATWSADNGATWSSTDTSHNAAGDLVRVSITYQYFLSIPYVPPKLLSMTSSAQTVIAD